MILPVGHLTWSPLFFELPEEYQEQLEIFSDLLEIWGVEVAKRAESSASLDAIFLRAFWEGSLD